VQVLGASGQLTTVDKLILLMRTLAKIGRNDDARWFIHAITISTASLGLASPVLLAAMGGTTE